MNFDKTKTVMFEGENGEKLANPYITKKGERLTAKRKLELVAEFAPECVVMIIAFNWNNADDRFCSFRSGTILKFYRLVNGSFVHTHDMNRTN